MAKQIQKNYRQISPRNIWTRVAEKPIVKAHRSERKVVEEVREPKEVKEKEVKKQPVVQKEEKKIEE